MALNNHLHLFILLLVLSVAATTTTAADHEATGADFNNINIHDITSTLFRKGYGAMAVLLPQILDPYLSQEATVCNPAVLGTLTIFAPTDYAFSYPSYNSYSVTDLVKHQIVPFLYLPKADFYLKLRVGDTVDTMLPSTPLMFTPKGFNHVPVKHYDIYNDGLVIIHGVDHFFDTTDQFYPLNTDWTSVAGYKSCYSTSHDTAPMSPLTNFITGSGSPKPSH